MWQRFTESARRAIFFAQEEAQRFGGNDVYPEHLLLGLIREDDTVAVHILENFEISLERIRVKIEREITRRDECSNKEMRLTPHAKRVVDLAYSEARRLNGSHIGTEHLLLGILCEGQSPAYQVLKALDLNLELVRTLMQSGIPDRLQQKQIRWRDFTEQMRQVLFRSQIEARSFGECDVCPEHLLLALIHETNCIGCRILARMGIPLKHLQSEIEKRERDTAGSDGSELRLTPQSLRILQHTQVEARLLNDQFIGTEHLLLALALDTGTVGSLLHKQDANRESSLKELEQSSQFTDEMGIEPAQETIEEEERQSYPFTEYARRAVPFGAREAARLGENYLGPEHLLLGALHYDDSAAALILQRFDITQVNLRAAIEQRSEPGLRHFGDTIGMLEWSQRVFKHAQEEAIRHNRDAIGTEHLLLAVLREDNPATQVLSEQEVDLKRIRKEISAFAETDPSDVSEPDLFAETTWEEMHGRLTERAQRVVLFALEWAKSLGENYISTEHLLFGLTEEDDTVAASILNHFGISRGQVRWQVERQVARGDGHFRQPIQLTPRAKRVSDLAYDEARQLNNSYVGTEHLLLGLIREGEGLAGRILHKLGLTLKDTRYAVIRYQSTMQAE